MKIGIITWLWHKNYGTALQAIALQKYLRNKSYQIKMIDLSASISKQQKVHHNISYYYHRIFYRADRVLHKQSYLLQDKSFRDFIKTNCDITEPISTTKDYISTCNQCGLLIFGSDQIWNPNWYHPYYYANLDGITSKRISYAPSFGVNNISGFSNADNIKSALLKFKAITVREENGAKIVQSLTQVKPQIVVDPTLLLTQQEWSQFERPTNIKGKYIVCYFLSDNRNHWLATKKFAKKHNLKLIIIPTNGSSCIKSKHIMREYGPNEFLSLIHHADYIATDSFHATVFSLIYHKQFLVFERHRHNDKNSQNSRIQTLLSLSGIGSSKIIPHNSKKITLQRVDYARVKPLLNKAIKASEEKLISMIEENGNEK